MTVGPVDFLTKEEFKKSDVSASIVPVVGLLSLTFYRFKIN